MGEAYLVRRGGGGGLNVSIVGGTVQPAHPKENMIWVNTDSEITEWVIGSKQPDAPQEGMVWISTEGGSDVLLDATGKNNIILSPEAGSQYISGEWVMRSALAYVGGAWVSLYTYLIFNGRLVKDMTIVGKRWKANAEYSGNNPSLTQQAGYVESVGTKSGYSMMYLEQVDLTNKKEIVAEGTFDIGNYTKLAVWSAVGTYVMDNVVAMVDLTKAGATLDISQAGLSGSYVVGATNQYTYSSKFTGFYVR